MEIERKNEGKRGRKEERKTRRKERKKENQLSSDGLRPVLLGKTIKGD